MSELIIRPYDNETDSAGVVTLWQSTFPQYPISPQHLEQLLTVRFGAHFVALIGTQIIGFCATYAEPSSSSSSSSKQAETGYLAIIAIHSGFRQKGHGTKLLQHVMDYLWRNSFKKVKVGSSMPRFWPGVPTDLEIQNQEFFLKNGFKEGTRCKDFYQPLSTFKAPQYLLDRTTSSGITFAPLTPSGYDECINAQQSIFPQWAAGYQLLHSKNLDDEIMVAFDGSRQVGWTLMLSPGKSRLWQAFAFLPVVGGADGNTAGNGKTGLIAAVGVSDDARGKGVGLGLICAAMEEMRRRGGIDGVFIDSVVLDNFYEKVGFRTWKEYREFMIEH